MLDELVDGVRTSTELRSRLRSLYSRSDVVWLAAGGLSAKSGIAHRAVQSALWRSGLHGEADNQRARVVVMDWTNADAFNADGLAFGAVVLRRWLPPSHVTGGCAFPARSAAQTTVAPAPDRYAVLRAVRSHRGRPLV